MIDGVQLIPLTTYPDRRGFFREALRASAAPCALAQFNHSAMHPGVVKAWHIHQRQTDVWYVVAGALLVVLHDLRPDSPTCGETQEALLGDGYAAALLVIPPGVAHGCRALTACHLLYVVNEEYDGTDEGRLAHDDPTIGYDWTGVEIK